MGNKKVSDDEVKKYLARYKSGEKLRALAMEADVSPQALGTRMRKFETVAPTKKRKPYKRKVEVMDIPLQSSSDKVALVLCKPEALARLIGELWK